MKQIVYVCEWKERSYFFSFNGYLLTTLHGSDGRATCVGPGLLDHVKQCAFTGI
jgi:hypothetical protein